MLLLVFGFVRVHTEVTKGLLVSFLDDHEAEVLPDAVHQVVLYADAHLEHLSLLSKHVDVSALRPVAESLPVLHSLRVLHQHVVILALVSLNQLLLRNVVHVLVYPLKAWVVSEYFLTLLEELPGTCCHALNFPFFSSQ